MIERVGNAIQHQMGLDDNMPEDLARAAIQAMREPTQEMVTAGEDYTDFVYSQEGDFLKGWQAAIDAALGERS